MSGCRHGKLTQWPVQKWDVNDHPNNVYWQERAQQIEDCIHMDHPEDYSRILDAAPQTTWLAVYKYLALELKRLVENTVNTVTRQAAV